MVDIEIKFEPGNGKQLDKLFEGLIKEYGRETVANPVMESLAETVEPLETQVRTETDRDTGELAEKAYSEAFINDGLMYAGVGYQFRKGKKDRPRAIAANIKEHGGKTRDYQQKRTLGKIFDRNKDKMQLRFFKSFEKKFNKLVKKHNRTKRPK